MRTILHRRTGDAVGYVCKPLNVKDGWQACPAAVIGSEGLAACIIRDTKPEVLARIGVDVAGGKPL